MTKTIRIVDESFLTWLDRQGKRGESMEEILKRLLGFDKK